MLQYWPQFAYLALTLIGIGVACEKNKEGILYQLIAEAIILFILYKGGFFSFIH